MENGKSYLVETVNWIWTGRVVAHQSGCVVLDDAAKVFDTGRYSDAMANGTLSEVEPVPSGQLVYIPWGAITGAVEWPHELPRAQQ